MCFCSDTDCTQFYFSYKYPYSLYTWEIFAYLCLVVWIHVDVHEDMFFIKISIFYVFFGQPAFVPVMTGFPFLGSTSSVTSPFFITLGWTVKTYWFIYAYPKEKASLSVVWVSAHFDDNTIWKHTSRINKYAEMWNDQILYPFWKKDKKGHATWQFSILVHNKQ